jgi:hypothetical protein
VTVRILFALAAKYDWEIEQMDVVTAFLNPLLQDEVYRGGVKWAAPEKSPDLSYAKRIPVRLCKAWIIVIPLPMILCILRLAAVTWSNTGRIWVNSMN